MLRSFTIAATAFAVLAANATLATAKECKLHAVVEEGTPYASRSLGAFPSSLQAWKRAVRAEFGPKWDTWLRAEDRRIDCEQVEIDDRGKRWICTRIARPCAGDFGEETISKSPYPGRLRYGDQGAAVRELQELLSEAGYEIPIDGDFGRLTRAAVRDFQRASRLRVSGIVSRETWDAL